MSYRLLLARFISSHQNQGQALGNAWASALKVWRTISNNIFYPLRPPGLVEK
jgi:hypothetical protein